MSQPSLPLKDLRVLEKADSRAGRLAGLLLADQGASVVALDRNSSKDVDHYLDRGKMLVPNDALAARENFDIVIYDKPAAQARLPWQISLGFSAAVPGDDACELSDEASDDLLNGMVGFYTDLCVAGPLVGRNVIYTPLPLCSVYAAVLGGVAALAALTDRTRSGAGRDIVIPRLSAGLSAIGVLAMDLQGIAPHLVPPKLLALAPELLAEIPKARQDEVAMLRFMNRVSPTTGCYKSSDGRLLMVVVTVNRKLALRMFDVLGLTERVASLGLVDASPYDHANVGFADRNVALPQGISSDRNAQLALWMTEAFATRPAREWEDLFRTARIPCAIVRDFSEWMESAWARDAGLVATIAGLEKLQLGRAVALQSAQPYPPLAAARRDESVSAWDPRVFATSQEPSPKPLAGYVVLDLSNVIAGPACGRLLGELGATVYKVDTTRPDHQPVVTIVWAAEANQGKKSILVDLRTPEGRTILEALVKTSDIVVMNSTDDGVRRLGLTADQLHALNPRAIGVQISAFGGERPTDQSDRPGYDPLLQATTGIMTRYGSPTLPLMHGIASCVDYLTGYLGAFAAVTALQAREQRGDGAGDFVRTSLASAATLVQFPFQHQPPAASAIGPTASGPSAAARLLQVSDGWIFAELTSDVSADLGAMTGDDAIGWLRGHGCAAAPVRSIGQLKEKYRQSPSATIRFRAVGGDGLQATILEPTWFQFDGQPLAPSSTPSRPGGDAVEILRALGFSLEACEALQEKGIIGRADWRHLDSR